MASAMPSASFFIFSNPSARHVSSIARKVPAILTSSGITFVAPILQSYQRSTPMELRVLITRNDLLHRHNDVRSYDNRVNARIRHGTVPPFAYDLDIQFIRTSHVHALTESYFPTGTFVATCWPKILAGLGFSKTPSLIMILAPPGAFSSAGWKINFTVPSKSSLMDCKICAVPNKDDVCTSCPQACITPGFCDL